ncbi:MAG: AhpC/TSA family protein [Bacteroidota bacterium]|jgi:peroxiredoxin|nr:AhpC/TSA family protein [Bacteroidota bacterium]
MKNLILIIVLAVGFTATAQGKPEGLFINSKAPDIKAKDQNGGDVVLKDLRKKGPVVVLFYRGHWCPYCNKELSRFQDSLQLLTDKGATLIAITPESTEGINQTIAKTGATFPIVFDEGMHISKKYGVSFVVDDKTAARYKNFGTDLLQINRQKTPTLPVPAVYVINRDGTITYRFFESDYKRRPSVQEIIQHLN